MSELGETLVQERLTLTLILTLTLTLTLTLSRPTGRLDPADDGRRVGRVHAVGEDAHQVVQVGRHGHLQGAGRMRLQPLLHAVAASAAYGCSLCRAWLPVAGETEHVVAASTGYGGVRCVTCSCRSSAVEVAGSGGAAQKMVMFS